MDAVRSGEKRVTAKTLPHYVLFWKDEEGWAQEDWRAAGAYVARFDAVAGFSEEQARLAELVTIVGGPAGVAPQVEARLRAAGCLVQRVAGDTPQETAALLQRMAREGRKWVKRA